MNERITQYLGRITGYWNNFSKKQRTLLISSLAFILIAVILLTVQFSKTEYEVAFTNLDSADAAGIINYLETGGVPYKLGPDGTSISVPSKQSARVKVDVGSQGIVQNGSIGWGIFNESSSLIGTTDNEFNVKYKSALNGEVEQLLGRMQGVSEAKVLINLPSENVFATVEEQEKASASIVIKFKPGYRITQEAVDGYFNLVKTSVPNLPVENISISASDDTVLLPTGQGGGQAGSLTTAVQENMALQKKFESDVRQSVKQFLSKLTGPDKIEVLVASKLNFDQISEKDNLVTPVDLENMKGIEISAQKLQESYTGEGDASGGVPGTGTQDVPGYPTTDTQGGSTSDKSSSTINYEVNRITRDIVASPYVIKDLTINVAVEPPLGQATLDPTTQTAIENILSNIVGSYLADSGSTYTDAELLKKVAVFSQPFHSDVVNKSVLSLSNPWLWGVGAAILLAGAGIGMLVFRRRKNKEEFEEEAIAQPLLSEFPSINFESVTNENQVRKQLETLAKKKPDEFVNLLRTWLSEE
ncbi:flagellar M-ring protein FliF [Paenibacillus anaericanus]|uniref:Flagellar M-ring protein n=1 Tax=Paenibacillus anaericanus TaxID=170367 RepID=A0A3S1BQ31_9BACL|nr:flagellar basal-body MS-ring/collar protein FliF [Paenibacillus anaericanus]MDQ0090628.1 flagellar M-ring protein FliF [Paenibacillus anaericanus]RUT46904.1 flagellar M-ring protein FliF [Paenibacillus anaericanus]